VGFEPFVVYRKVGYKFGMWHDVGWWQRALAPHPATPPDPIDVPAVARRADWSSLLGAGLGCIRIDTAC
jgi:phosphinothricin acetyltransferase